MKANNMKVSVKIGRPFKFIYFIIAVLTAMIGYEIHHNGLYSIVNFIFWPISWIYWLICHDVNMSVIKATFGFFLK